MPRVDARGVRHRCKRGSNKSHVRLSQLSYQAHFCRRTLRSGPASAPCACRRSRCCRCVCTKNAWITNGDSIVCKACQRPHLRDTSRNLRRACRVMPCMRSSADENCRKLGSGGHFDRNKRSRCVVVLRMRFCSPPPPSSRCCTVCRAWQTHGARSVWQRRACRCRQAAHRRMR